MKGNIVNKNKVGQGNSKKDFKIGIPELDTEIAYTLEIPEETLSKEQVLNLFSAAQKEIESSFLGTNKSLNNITEPIVLKEFVMDDVVRCDWNLDGNDIVLPDGSLKEETIPKKGAVIKANVTLTYNKEKCDYTFFFQVKRKKLSKIEQVISEINQSMNSKNQANNKLKLPKKIAGYNLKWNAKREFTGEIIFALGICACIAIHFAEKEKIQKQKEKRFLELEYAYAEVVSKLCLLLGAGMTMRLAWEKIAYTYQSQVNEGLILKQAAYEEMLLSYAQLQEGMGELEVYHQFAKRCNNSKYTKLVSLLTQNLKKGQCEFILLLEKESQEAFTERKLLAKKLGEEASTKLLLPMMIMLFIVLAILVVPAIFSFQI
jgi:hypothetical protein